MAAASHAAARLALQRHCACVSESAARRGTAGGLCGCVSACRFLLACPVRLCVSRVPVRQCVSLRVGVCRCVPVRLCVSVRLRGAEALGPANTAAQPHTVFLVQLGSERLVLLFVR